MMSIYIRHMYHNYDPYYLAYTYADYKLNIYTHIYTNYAHIFSVYNFFVYTHLHPPTIATHHYIISIHIYHTIYEVAAVIHI